MSRVYIVNTYFQLISAVMIEKSKKCKENDRTKADLIISNHTENMFALRNNIETVGLFDNVYLADTKKLCKTTNSKKEYFYKIKSMLFYKKYMAETIGEIDHYDHIYLNNLDFFAQIFYMYNTEKKGATVSRFEEGIGSYLEYNDREKTKKLIDIYTRVFHKQNIFGTIKDYYFYNCSYIKFKENDIAFKEIPKLDSDIKFKDILNDVFGVEQMPREYYEKSIVFEDCFYCDGLPIDDIQAYKTVADMLGKENVVAKLHPRNTVDRFKKIGINVVTGFNYPWEIIELNKTQQNIAFYFTVASTSVLASSIYFNNKNKIVFLYKLVKSAENQIGQELKKFIEEMAIKNPECIYIPETYKELEKILNS